MDERDAMLLRVSQSAGLGTLVPIVAHEINNPLALITNNLYLLGRDLSALGELLRLYQEADAGLAVTQPELLARVRALAEQSELAYTLENLPRLLDRARTGVRRIQQMVRDLVEFGRPGAAVVQGVDINAGIEAIVRLYQRRAEKHSITLQSDLASLPPCVCNPAAVNQAVMNLVQNAQEACPDGATITVRTRRADHEVEIHVEDTGSGIDPAIAPQIFDLGYTTRPGALGLGLWIVRALLDAQGGQIDVISVPNQGAHFTVHLPCIPEPAPATGS